MARRSRPSRWGRPRDLAVDLAIVLLLVMAMASELDGSPSDSADVVALLVIVLAAAPTLLRRRHPLVALIGCGLTLGVLESQLDIYQTIPLPAMLAGYSLARAWERGRAVRMGLVVAGVVLVNLWIVARPVFFTFETPKNMAFVALPIVLGIAARGRQDAETALVDRAERAEHTREAEARRRVDEERLRIARDLHDLVAHSLVAINVQAGVAAHVGRGGTEGDLAHETLREIKRVSGEALTDLRSTIGVLRSPDDAPPVAPTATLADLRALTGSLGAAGVQVVLELDHAAEAPAALQTTAYRIVQEALTNTMRYAAPTRATVTVRTVTTEAGGIDLLVTDEGPRGAHDPRPGSGNGVRGMHERAQAVGGHLSAGPVGAGWRVHAVLPLTAPEVLE